MQTISNPVKIGAVLAWTVLLTVTTPVEGGERYEAEQLTTQQCSMENDGQILLTHGRHHHHRQRHYHPYPPPPLPPLLHHPALYPPYYPYPYPLSGVCRNQRLFCHMNVLLPVGSPCVCHAPFGVVWFRGQVAAY